MTKYAHQGRRWQAGPDVDFDIHDTLPPGTYAIRYQEVPGFYYLEEINNFEVSGKIYGETSGQADRIVRTFLSREKSTGVMLSGEKGSGKTLMAKLLSTRLADRGIPTLVVTESHHGEAFNSFVQMIEQEAIIVFDEFEKVYDKNEQEAMLTLLDGVFSSKKLFVITTNDRFRIDENMRNRPGRIFYRVDYTGLKPEFIREYCADNLNDTEHTEAICRVSVLFDQFNFDMLKALVEEMNRYQEGPREAMALLNAKPESSGKAQYELLLTIAGHVVPTMDDRWWGNPLVESLNVWASGKALSAHARAAQAIRTVAAAAVSSNAFDMSEEVPLMSVPSVFVDDDDKDGGGGMTCVFNPGDLKDVDVQSGTFRLVNPQGQEVRLTRVVPKYADYSGVY